MKKKFNVEYNDSTFNFEWDTKDYSVCQIKDNRSKINYGNGKAKSIESANSLAVEMLKSMFY